MERTTVYKVDSKGKQRQWTIWVETSAKTPEEFASFPADIKIESGLIEGKKVNESITISSGKNLGKANATNPFEQAVLQAKAKLEQKLRGEYVKELSQVSQGLLRGGISAPMLAQKYDKTLKQIGSKDLAKMKIQGHTIYVQPKYDGFRCLIKVTPTSVELYSRKGDKMLPVPHVEEQIRKSYDEAGYTEEIVLDGELYSTEISFNTLSGVLRKEKKDELRLAQLATVGYYVYDMQSPLGYRERYEQIKPFGSGCVILTPSHEIIATDENIEAKFEEFVEEGHEGLMIRTLHTGYENKRSWQLVKVKVFEDAEFLILDVEMDSMGRLGKFLMELDYPVVNSQGKTETDFRAGTRGISHEEGREILANKEEYIGKMATIRYFGRDPKPRFPKFKGVREDV